MKNILLSLVFVSAICLFPPSARAQYTGRHCTVVANAFAHAGSLSCTIPGTAAGSVFIMGVQACSDVFGAFACEIVSITPSDGASLTWTTLESANYAINVGATQTASVLLSCAPGGATSGSHSFTATFGHTTKSTILVVWEMANFASGCTTDGKNQTTSASGVSNPVMGPSVTTTLNGDILFGFISDANGPSCGANTGWTAVPGNNIGGEQQCQSTAAPFQSNFLCTGAPAFYWVASVAFPVGAACGSSTIVRHRAQVY